MRTVLVIGIGAGDPEQVTIQAIKAMNRVDVFFVVDKGTAAAELVEVRKDILARYVTERTFRLVELADPPRDRASGAYRLAVSDWHRRRAQLYARAIHDELDDDGCCAFLVWGDPTLYDSTLRILEEVLASGTVSFDYEVVPGMTSVQALAARHRLPLHGVGEGVRVTTGRRLAEDWATGADNVVVMLDGESAFTQLGGADADIFWGAYLGMPDEITIRGRLCEVGELIRQTRESARAKRGWIMDIYLLRRRRSETDTD
jgi:precorrin-6A synthase